MNLPKRHAARPDLSSRMAVGLRIDVAMPQSDCQDPVPDILLGSAQDRTTQPRMISLSSKIGLAR
jgi:hypothetical protein